MYFILHITAYNWCKKNLALYRTINKLFLQAWKLNIPPQKIFFFKAKIFEIDCLFFFVYSFKATVFYIFSGPCSEKCFGAAWRKPVTCLFLHLSLSISECFLNIVISYVKQTNKTNENNTKEMHYIYISVHLLISKLFVSHSIWRNNFIHQRNNTIYATILCQMRKAG